MRRVVGLTVMAALGLSGVASAQSGDAYVLEKVEMGDFVTTTIVVSGCKVIIPGKDYRTTGILPAPFFPKLSQWTGPCNSDGLADGKGKFRECTTNGGQIYCNEYTGTMVDGLLQGRVHWRRIQDNWKGASTPLSAWGEMYNEWQQFKDGCEPGWSRCNPAGALQLQTRYASADSADRADSAGGGNSAGDDDDAGASGTGGQQCAQLAAIINSPPPPQGALAALTHTTAVLKASIALIDRKCGKPWIVSTDQAAIAAQRAQLYDAWKKARTGCIQLTAGVSSEEHIASLDDDNPCKEVVRPS